MGRRDRGQVVPLYIGIVVFFGFALVALAHLSGGAVDRAAAKRAADVAALAGAAEGEGAARDYAARNGAALTDYDQTDEEVSVGVDYGDAHALAKARRDSGGIALKPGDPAPALRAALARAEQILGHPVDIVRAAEYVVELTPSGYAELAPRAAEAGLCPAGPNSLAVCGSS